MAACDIYHWIRYMTICVSSMTHDVTNNFS